MKKLTALAIVLLVNTIVFAQDEQSSRIVDTNTFSIDGGDVGALQSSVNLFTGDVQFPLGLISAPGKQGMGISVAISYNSNVQHKVNTVNEESPTGILGLGWSLDLPQIMLDHKNTGTIHDDEYYLTESGNNTRLIYTGSETYYSKDLNSIYTAEKFESKNYTNWKIRYVRSRERWEITKEDGTICIYGDQTDHATAVQWVVRWGNWIGNSSVTNGQSQMAFVWNLSRMVNRLETDYVNYAYDKVESRVGWGLHHTEASYLSQIENALGYRVVFNYGIKDGVEYYEPHKEQQSEPDAYQERYERKYLSSLYLYKGTDLIKTVAINYHSLNKLSTTDAYKKRLISGIRFTDRFGGNHRPFRFDYFTSGSWKGFLQTITTATGATVTYTYQTKSIGDLDLTVTAPSGYSEPQVWQGPGYVVVGWRQLSSGSHDNSDRPVQIFVYEWEGDWKEKYITTIQHVDSEHTNYTEFFVQTQEDFFAIATPGEDDYCELRLVSRNAQTGGWSLFSQDIYIGSYKPSLVTGENFAAVGQRAEDSNDRSKLNLLIKRNDLNQWSPIISINDHANTRDPFHLGNLNYIFTAYEIGDYNYRNITYLTRDKLQRSVTNRDGNDTWDANAGITSNNFVIFKYSNGKSLIYQWDVNYNEASTELGDGFSIFMKMQSVNNSIVQASDYYAGKIALGRFNGLEWRLYKEDTQNHIWRRSLNEDFFIWSDYRGGWDGFRVEFNPNANAWKSRVQLPEHSSYPNGGQTVGSFWGNYSYYWPYIHKRNNSGSWNNTYAISELSDTNGESSYVYGSPNFFFHEQGDGQGIYVYTLNNGKLTKQSIDGSGYSGFFANEAGGLNSFITYNSSNEWSATGINLHRVIKNQVGGALADYPVKYIAVNDGISTTYNSYDFSTTDASTDASGLTAQYNLAITVPGNSTTSSFPNGKTETYFFNAKANADSYLTSVNSYSDLVRGQSYLTRVLNSSSSEVSRAATYYKRYSKNRLNASSEIIETSHIVLPLQSLTTVDNIDKTQTYSYNAATFQLQETKSYNYDAAGNQDEYKQTLKYHWEVYDTDRSDNFLSPVVQQKSYVNSVEKSSSVTTWHEGLPFRSYTKTASGSDFTDWTNTTTPPAQWQKTGEFYYDGNKNLIESIDALGIVSSIRYGYYGYDYLPLLSVSNADLDETWIEDFNDQNATSGLQLWSMTSSSYWDYSGGSAFFNNTEATGTLQAHIGLFGVDYIMEFDLRLEPDAANGYASVHFAKTSSGTGYELKVYPSGDLELLDNTTLLASYHTDELLEKWQPYRVVYDANNELHIYVGNKKVIRKAVDAKTGTYLQLKAADIKAAFDNLRIYPSDAYASSTSYDLTYRIPVESKKESGSTNYFMLNEYNSVYSSADHNMNPNGSSSFFNAHNFGAVSDSNLNISLSTSTRGTKGFMENFNVNLGQWTAISSENSSVSTWQFTDGYLLHTNTGGASSGVGGKFVLSLPEAITNDRIAVEVQVTTPGNLDQNTFGFGAGSSSWNTTSGSSAIWSYFNREDLNVNTSINDLDLFSNYTYHFLAVLDMNTKKLDFYMDGKLLENDISFSNTGVNEIGKIVLFNYGHSADYSEWKIDNVLVYTDPVISSSFLDATGKVRQLQSEMPGNKVMVSETFYDGMGRPYIQTRALEVTGSLGFKPNFAGWNASTKVLTGTDVVNAYGNLAYSATLFDNSPLSRPLKSKMPGNDFVLDNTHITSMSYGRNGQSGFDIDDDISNFFPVLPNSQYQVVKSVNPDGLESYEMTDKNGNVILTKTGPVKGVDIKQQTVSLCCGSQTHSFTATHDQLASFSYYGTSFKVGTTAGGSDIVNDNSGNVSTGRFLVIKGITYYATYSGSYGASMRYDITEKDADIYLYSRYSFDDATNTAYSYAPEYFKPGLSAGERNNFVSSSVYDYRGNVSSSTTTDGGLVEYKYDNLGRLRFVQDAKGRAQGSFSYIKYDGFGRVIEDGYISSTFSSTNPNTASWPSTPATWRKKYTYGNHENTTYDRGGVIKVEVNNDTDASAEVIEESETLDGDAYITSAKTFMPGDPVNLPAITREYNNGGQVITMKYTKTSESSIGEVITGNVAMEAENAELAGTVVETTGALTVLASGSITLKPGFWARSGSSFIARAGATEVDTEEVAYHYDISGRLVSIGSAADPDLYARYSYASNGALSQENLNNNALPVNYTYYADNGLLKTISQGSKFSETIEYTTNAYGSPSGYYSGQISKNSVTINGHSYTTAYKYDKAGRLLAANHSNNTYDVGVGGEIAYDRNGNIQSLRKGGAIRTYSYIPGTNKLSAVSGGLGEYTYDQIGNVISNTPQSLSALTYDPWSNKTTQISVSGSGNTRFQYGAGDQRVKKEDEEGANIYKTWYVSGNNANPLLEISESAHGTDKTKFIYGPGGLIAYKKNSDLFYTIRDYLGSIRVITTPSGNVMNYYSYMPFGKTMGSYSFSVNAFSYQYTGQEYDEETGIYNYKARMYDEETGRFYGMDPAGQFASPYVGMGNNPVNYVDPDGEWVHIAIGAVVGGAINLAMNWDNIDNPWEGIAAFGIGAGAGAATAACGTCGGALWIAAAGGAATSATNNIISQTGNGVGLNDVDYGQVGLSAAVGGVSGMAGYGAGKWATNNLANPLINGLNVKGPALSGLINGAIGGAAGGAAGGFTGGFILSGGDVGAGLDGAWNGFTNGAIIGGGTGVGMGYYQARRSNVNPWTGKSLSPQAKGDLGVQQAIKDIQKMGGKVLGERPAGYKFGDGRRGFSDLIVEIEGEIVIVEVKYGDGAALNPNQKINYPRINQGDFPTFSGPNGQVIPSGTTTMKVIVIHYTSKGRIIYSPYKK